MRVISEMQGYSCIFKVVVRISKHVQKMFFRCQSYLSLRPFHFALAILYIWLQAIYDICCSNKPK